MTEERSPLEVVLDLFVFAPVGMILTLTEDLPKLVEKGRGRIESQLGMARMMGEFAAPQLQTEATKLVKGLLDRVPAPGPPPAASSPGAAVAAPPSVPDSADGSQPGETGGPADPPEGSAPASRTPAGGSPSPPTTSRPAAPATPATPATPASLAIPGYDSLSAMQVVSRLAGLGRSELEAVRSYEEAHRHRKTIINRADQLLVEAS